MGILFSALAVLAFPLFVEDLFPSENLLLHKTSNSAGYPFSVLFFTIGIVYGIMFLSISVAMLKNNRMLENRNKKPG